MNWVKFCLKEAANSSSGLWRENFVTQRNWQQTSITKSITTTITPSEFNIFMQYMLKLCSNSSNKMQSDFNVMNKKNQDFLCLTRKLQKLVHKEPDWSTFRKRQLFGLQPTAETSAAAQCTTNVSVGRREGGVIARIPCSCYIFGVQVAAMDGAAGSLLQSNHRNNKM